MKKKAKPNYVKTIRHDEEVQKCITQIQKKQDIKSMNDVFVLSVKKVAEQDIKLQ